MKKLAQLILMDLKEHLVAFLKDERNFNRVEHTIFLLVSSDDVDIKHLEEAQAQLQSEESELIKTSNSSKTNTALDETIRAICASKIDLIRGQMILIESRVKYIKDNYIFF